MKNKADLSVKVLSGSVFQTELKYSGCAACSPKILSISAGVHVWEDGDLFLKDCSSPFSVVT